MMDDGWMMMDDDDGCFPQNCLPNNNRTRITANPATISFIYCTFGKRKKKKKNKKMEEEEEEAEAEEL